MSTFTLAGRRYTIPVPILGFAIDGAERMVAGVVPAAETRDGNDSISYCMTYDAADLTLANAARAPLCYQHMRTLDGLLGALTAAWIDAGRLCFTARLAPLPDADRLWTLLTSGFAVSISIGTEVIATEVGGTSVWGGQKLSIQRWRLTEISAVLHGANSAAHMVRLNSPVGREILATRTTPDVDAARDRLRLDTWSGWSTRTGVKLAEELGVNRDRVCDLLDREVAAHSKSLIEALAGASA